MAFEELQDQLKDKWQEFKGQLDDSPAFNTLKERFETLNPTSQKAIIWSGIVIFTFFMFSCPYSYWSTSTEYVAEYETTRDMIRDLLKTSHIANQMGDVPSALTESQLRTEINRIVSDVRLLPEQNLGVDMVSANDFGRPLAPKQINQEGWLVRLQQLNTKQIAEIGFRLQNMNAGVKLAGMDLSVFSEDPRYYNAQYRLIKFITPEPAQNEEKTDGNNDRRGQ